MIKEALINKILSELYPDFKVRVIRVYNDMNRINHRQMRPTEGLRSYKRTEELWAKGRSTQGPIVTYKHPGTSNHCFGIAVDSCFDGADPYLEKDPNGPFLWNEYARIAEAHGLVAGGNWKQFKDRPHIELTYGLRSFELYQLYKLGGILAVWKTLDEIIK